MQKTIKTLKAMSDQNRLRILIALSSQPACVCELVWALDINQPNLSHHLRILEDAGLIEGKRNGNWMEYRLSIKPSLKVLIESILESVKNDSQIKMDISRAEKSNRLEICKNKVK